LEDSHHLFDGIVVVVSIFSCMEFEKFGHTCYKNRKEIGPDLPD